MDIFGKRTVAKILRFSFAEPSLRQPKYVGAEEQRLRQKHDDEDNDGDDKDDGDDDDIHLRTPWTSVLRKQ